MKKRKMKNRRDGEEKARRAKDKKKSVGMKREINK